ncbi:MAG: hypothetical protein ACREDO_07745 [Methyloceanibacter sp.]
MRCTKFDLAHFEQSTLQCPVSPCRGLRYGLGRNTELPLGTLMLPKHGVVAMVPAQSQEKLYALRRID